MTGMPAWRATGATVRHRLGKQRPQDERGPGLDGLLGGGLGAFRRALVVLDDELQGRVVALEQGELGRLLQALADQTRLAGRRDRQDQRDLDQLLGGRGRRIALAPAAAA